MAAMLDPLSVIIPSAHAQYTIIPDFGTSIPGCDFLYGNFDWVCFPFYIQYLANLVVTFTLTLCIIMLIYNGYRYAVGPVLGQGTNEGAKKGIFFALLGAAISLLAYIIVDVVFTALNTGT